MATTDRAAVGIDHPTVVPTNFEPDSDGAVCRRPGGARPGRERDGAGEEQ